MAFRWKTFRSPDDRIPAGGRPRGAPEWSSHWTLLDSGSEYEEATWCAASGPHRVEEAAGATPWPRKVRAVAV